MLNYFIIIFLLSIQSGFNTAHPFKYNRRRQLPANASNEFDILVLAQSWPQTNCWDLNRLWSQADSRCSPCSSAKIQSNWTLHGLWPSNRHGASPEDCNREVKFKKEDLNQTLIRQMERKWQSSHMKKSNYQFWQHEWKKHGTCSLQLNDTNSPNKYFRHSLSLFDQYNVGEILSNKGILPGNEYGVLEIHNAIKSSLDASPFVMCARHPDTAEQYLTQINICFNKNFHVVDCKDKANISNCSQKKKVIYPKTLPSCH